LGILLIVAGVLVTFGERLLSVSAAYPATS
jgi:hypothetical protein